MICVSVGNISVKECEQVLERLDLAEVRLDTMDVDLSSVKRIFSRPARLIATCRPGRYSQAERLGLLSFAIEAGAAYVDIETQAAGRFREEIMACAARNRAGVIVSYHNYMKTPGRIFLEKTVTDAFRSGASLAKVACMVRSASDNIRLLGLLHMKKYPGRIISLGMGDIGRITRVASVFLGSPFTYASPGDDNPLAPGQMSAGHLEQALELIRNG